MWSYTCIRAETVLWTTVCSTCGLSAGKTHEGAAEEAMRVMWHKEERKQHGEQLCCARARKDELHERQIIDH